MLHLIGKKFSRLIVVCKTDNDKYGKTQWLCKCNCGKRVVVTGSRLKNGNTKSCGCLRLDKLIGTSTKHGHAKKNKKSRIYRIWIHMIQRCVNPNNKKYPRYGGRGIGVCERWKRFENFLEDMGKLPTEDYSIDRIDNNGNYSMSNCRWETCEQQSRNTSKNRLITHDGKSKCLAEWSEKTGINRNTITSRLEAGWPIKEVFTKAVSKFRDK